MDKEFKKFVTVYIFQLCIIAVMVLVLVLASQGTIPSVFQPIGFLCIVVTVVSFNIFANRYKKR